MRLADKYPESMRAHGSCLYAVLETFVEAGRTVALEECLDGRIVAVDEFLEGKLECETGGISTSSACPSFSAVGASICRKGRYNAKITKSHRKEASATPMRMSYMVAETIGVCRPKTRYIKGHHKARESPRTSADRQRTV